MPIYKLSKLQKDADPDEKKLTKKRSSLFNPISSPDDSSQKSPKTEAQNEEPTDCSASPKVAHLTNLDVEELSDSSKEASIRLATSMLFRVLECGKSGEKGIFLTVKSDEIIALLDFVKPLFLSQPSCVEIDGPINVCGDIHGQFSDLLRLLDKAGFPHRQNYLFLGDYVDRGRQSLETILLLFSYKLLFPTTFFLLRGNHECPSINKVYGFYDECARKYNCAKKERRQGGVWEAFQDAFATMPLTAVIGERILCMHGGLSPKLRSLDQLRCFRRPNLQPEPNSLEIDVLWSDPSNTARGWAPNARGVSYVFGAEVLRKICNSLKIELVVRAHQVVQDGYEFFAHRRLVTIFSAPFYCGQFDNAAAVLRVSDELVCSFLILRPKKYLPKRKLTPAGANEN